MRCMYERPSQSDRPSATEGACSGSTSTPHTHTLTYVHCQLHWLPVRQRVQFKVATLVHQSLSGVSPSYLADDCRLVADARERRCAFHSEPNMRRDADIQHLWRQSVLGCWTQTVEQSSIAPDADLSYNEFRWSLKTYLFGQWGYGAAWTLIKWLEIFVLTFLLTRVNRPLTTGPPE